MNKDENLPSDKPKVYPFSKDLCLRGESKRIYDIMVHVGEGCKAKKYDFVLARGFGVDVVNAIDENIGSCSPQTLSALTRKGLLKFAGTERRCDLYELTGATSVAPKISANPKRDAIAKQLNTLASQFDGDIPMDSFYEMMKELRRIAEKIQSELADK